MAGEDIGLYDMTPVQTPQTRMESQRLSACPGENQMAYSLPISCRMRLKANPGPLAWTPNLESLLLAVSTNWVSFVLADSRAPDFWEIPYTHYIPCIKKGPILGTEEFQDQKHGPPSLGSLHTHYIPALCPTLNLPDVNSKPT